MIKVAQSKLMKGLLPTGGTLWLCRLFLREKQHKTYEEEIYSRRLDVCGV